MSPPSYGSALLLGTTLLLGFTIITCSPRDAPTSEKIQKKAPAPSVQQLKVTLPEHRILDERVYDVPLKTQVILDVLVSGTISRVGLTSLLDELYSNTQARRGFKYHNPPTHVFIYLYTSTERSQSGMAEWIAMLSKIGAREKPEIRISEIQLIEAGVVEEERFGLSTEQRKPIYWDILKARHRANREAEQRYPMSGRFSLAEYENQKELENSLREQYQYEIATQYNVEPSQIDEIAREGMAKQWLLPTTPDAKEYWLRISPKLIGNRVLTKIETNLPRGSLLRAELVRYFLHEGETERRVVELDRRDDVIVSNGSFELALKAEDQWIKSKAPSWGKAIHRIFPSAEVAVRFSSVWQPADVLTDVGEWGEKMKGNQVRRWQSTIAQGAAITVKRPIDIPVKQ